MPQLRLMSLPNCKGNNCEDMVLHLTVKCNLSDLEPCWELANSVHPRDQIFDNPGTIPLPHGFKHALLKSKHS